MSTLYFKIITDKIKIKSFFQIINNQFYTYLDITNTVLSFPYFYNIWRYIQVKTQNYIFFS